MRSDAVNVAASIRLTCGNFIELRLWDDQHVPESAPLPATGTVEVAPMAAKAEGDAGGFDGLR